jgi:hypothetical protein
VPGEMVYGYPTRAERPDWIHDIAR